MPSKRKPKSGYLVFISHSSKDKWIARQVARLIETAGRKQGIRVFLDEKDIEGGQSISKTILANLRACDELLVLLTRDSVGRPWVLVEIGGALALEKHLVAIVNHVNHAEIPDAIAGCLAIDLNDFDTYLEQVINRAKKMKAL
jgi:hypothetical protein